MNGKDLYGRALGINFSGGSPPQSGASAARGGFGGDRQPRSFGGAASDEVGEANTVFVGNLGFKTQEYGIRNFFAICGAIAQVRIAMGDDGWAKGFAHVHFESSDSAKQAVQSLNG